MTPQWRKLPGFSSDLPLSRIASPTSHRTLLFVLKRLIDPLGRKERKKGKRVVSFNRKWLQPESDTTKRGVFTQSEHEKVKIMCSFYCNCTYSALFHLQNQWNLFFFLFKVLLMLTHLFIIIIKILFWNVSSSLQSLNDLILVIKELFKLFWKELYMNKVYEVI